MARPKHRTKPGGAYFVTTDTWQRRRLFQNSSFARVLEETLFKYRDDGHYFVHSYVIMPEHLHLILTPGRSTALERAMQLIKGGSSHEIGKREGMRLPVWHTGFTEHLIRDATDFESHVRYIDNNPVKAGLAARPQEYPFCSARGMFRLDAWPVTSGAKALPKDNDVSAGFKPRPSVSVGGKS